MGDVVENQNPNNGGDTKNTVVTPPAGTSPDNKNDAGAGEGNGVDTSKFTDADWDKIYSDPKLYNHSRFKTLSEQAKKANKLEEDQRKANEETLKKNQQWEELAKTKETESNTWKQKAEKAQIDNRIAMEAQKLGVVDLEAVTVLIDRKTIKLNEDGSVDGVTDAVKALIEAKPYLKGNNKNTTTVGSATNPGDQNTNTPTFTMDQIKDPVFYRAHQKEIDKAFQLGQIKA